MATIPVINDMMNTIESTSDQTQNLALYLTVHVNYQMEYRFYRLRQACDILIFKMERKVWASCLYATKIQVQLEVVGTKCDTHRCRSQARIDLPFIYFRPGHKVICHGCDLRRLIKLPNRAIKEDIAGHGKVDVR